MIFILYNLIAVSKILGAKQKLKKVYLEAVETPTSSGGEWHDLKNLRPQISKVSTGLSGCLIFQSKHGTLRLVIDTNAHKFQYTYILS